MTREEAIFCEKSYIGETDCTDCKYYGTETCKSRESHRMAIKALEQEPRRGYWIKHNTPNNTYYYDCSLCGCVAPCTETADSYLWKLSNFCPDCGAKMETMEAKKMTFEGVKEIFKKSIDTTDTMNQAIENLIQSIYLKGYNDALEQEPYKAESEEV